MKLLITGGLGFLGSNLASEEIKKQYEVLIFDNLSRNGCSQNLDWLSKQGRFSFHHGDIRNSNDISRVVSSFKPDAIFHLAGQVAMTTSIENPRHDFEVNALGTLNLLESVRLYAPEAVVLYSSTNKVYGDLEWVSYMETETRYHAEGYASGFNETLPLDFSTPYGCSKGSADQYMLDYSRVFGLKTLVFRHSSMYGGRQFATVDQGWVGWFCKQAIVQKMQKNADSFSISGNGKQVRDVLHAEDLMSLYFGAISQELSSYGLAFNVGGGMSNSLSLLELFGLIEKKLDMRLRYHVLAPRKSDQKVFVSDNSKISDLLNWQPLISSEEGVSLMLQWVK